MSDRAVVSFVDAVLLLGEELEPAPGMALNVAGGRIHSIGAPLPEARVVSLPNKLVCPMFVNAHCHLGDTGAKELGAGLPLEQVVNPPDGLKHRFLQSLQPEAHIAQMRHGLLEMLANGIIACADFREQGLSGVQALRQAAAGLPIQVRVLGRMAENGSLDQMLAEGEAILEAGDGLGIRDSSSYPLPLLARLRAACPHKIFAMHASESRAAEQDSQRRYGCGQAAQSFAWRPNFLVHLTHTPPEELEEMQHLGIGAVGCPRTNGLIGDGLPDLATWQHAGLQFGLGSDNLMLTSPDLFREMDYASRTSRGLEEDAAAISITSILKAATIWGARLLGYEDDLGSLTAGKEASFIVLDLSSPNLAYTQDYRAAVVHRACKNDIHQIIIQGSPLADVLHAARSF